MPPNPVQRRYNARMLGRRRVAGRRAVLPRGALIFPTGLRTDGGSEASSTGRDIRTRTPNVDEITDAEGYASGPGGEGARAARSRDDAERRQAEIQRDLDDLAVRIIGHPLRTARRAPHDVPGTASR